MKQAKQSGVTLIEVIVGISIVAVTLIAIGFGVNAYVEARRELITETKSSYLIEEGYEIIRAIRDNNWNTIEALTTGTTHYLTVSTTTLAVSTTPEIIDTTYRRSFVVRAVYRNASSDIVPSSSTGATVDAGSRQIDVSVAGPTGTTTLSAILSNLHAL